MTQHTYTKHEHLIISDVPLAYAYPEANPQECARLCDMDSTCSGYIEEGCKQVVLDTTQNSVGEGPFLTHSDSPYGKMVTETTFHGSAPPTIYLRHDRLTADQKTALARVNSDTNPQVIPTNPQRHFSHYENVDVASSFPAYYRIREGVNENPPFLASTAKACMETCLKYPASECMAVSVTAMDDGGSPYVHCQMRNLTFCAEGTECEVVRAPGTDVFTRVRNTTASMKRALTAGGGGLFAFGK